MFDNFEKIMKNDQSLDKTGFIICSTILIVGFSPIIIVLGMLIACALGF